MKLLAIKKDKLSKWLYETHLTSTEAYGGGASLMIVHLIKDHGMTRGKAHAWITSQEEF